MRANAKPIGGRLLTPSYKIILLIAALGVATIIWRLAAGLGATTALSDGYPWGLWIAFDVVVGTALACGGYAVAILLYVFNRGQYHPLIRPAILTSALGYSLAGLAVAIDVGRPWLLWKVPLMIWRWNVNSVLLEVAVCIMAYVVVLWIELTPALLDRWSQSGHEQLRRRAERIRPSLDRALIWITALGILLPTMHQSSLGTLMLLAGPKLSPIWSTPLLPMLFLITSVAMGYAAVVFETTFSSVAFGLRADTAILASIQRVAAIGVAIVVAFRLVDLALRGDIGLVFQFGLPAILFWIENVLFVLPLLLLFGQKRRVSLGSLFRSALLLALGGTLYRFDTFLVGFNPGAGWHYFPSIPEILVSVGLVAIELAAYIAIVKTFPILSGVTETSPTAVD
jgi:Ni/Fe-hydrogenase subunit HybB-like protein